MNRVAVLSCIALMAVGLGCSNSSEPPTKVVSEAELSGRYEPGTADANWIWFSGVAESPTFKGQKRMGPSFRALTDSRSQTWVISNWFSPTSPALPRGIPSCAERRSPNWHLQVRDRVVTSACKRLKFARCRIQKHQGSQKKPSSPRASPVSRRPPRLMSRPRRPKTVHRKRMGSSW